MTNDAEWNSIKIPTQWGADYRKRARKSGRSLSDEMLIDLAKGRGEPAPSFPKGRIGRPPKA